MSKAKIEIILQIIMMVVEMLVKVVNNLKNEKGGDDDENIIEKNRELHGA